MAGSHGVWLSWIGWPLLFFMHICHSAGLAGLAEVFLIAAGGWVLHFDRLVPSCPACYWLGMSASLGCCSGLIRLA